MHTHSVTSFAGSDVRLTYPAPFSSSRNLKITSASVLLSSKREMAPVHIDSLRDEHVGDRGGSKIDGISFYQ